MNISGSSLAVAIVLFASPAAVYPDEVQKTSMEVATAEAKFDQGIEAARRILMNAYRDEIESQIQADKIANVRRVILELQLIDCDGLLMQPDLDTRTL